MNSYIIEATGSAYCYHYEELPLETNEAQIRGYCAAVKHQFRPVAASFSDDSNAAWLLRHYLAIKFTLAASIMSGSAEYAFDHNLLMAVPYFNYYTLLNCCRAFLLTSPDVEWKGTETLKMNHSKIINLTSDLMKRLDRNPARKWRERLESARDHRELYSYRFPASGPDITGTSAFDHEQATRLARLIAELAMLNSECFEAVLAKYDPQIKKSSPWNNLEFAEAYDVAGARLVDRDDRYRFRKFLQGWGRVSTLEVMTSDGLVEDFFGSWCAAEDHPAAFDPDRYSGRILYL